MFKKYFISVTAETFQNLCFIMYLGNKTNNISCTLVRKLVMVLTLVYINISFTLLFLDVMSKNAD